MKVLILTTVRAPYRVELFNELGQNLDLTVCFEQDHDVNRNKQWYSDATDHFIIKELRNSKLALNKVKYDFISILKSDKWDLCIFYEFSTKTAMLGMLYCILHGIKYALNCDGAIETQNIIKDFAKDIFVKNASGCFGNGLSAKMYFEYHHADIKNIYQHPFASLHEKDLLKKPLTELEKKNKRGNLNLPLDKTIVISVGTFEERKGFHHLINVFSELKGEDIVLLLIGGGPLKDEYEYFIKEKDLDNVMIKDFIKKPMLVEYFKAADIFAFPTLLDIWGLVVVEAMSFGLSIISTPFANSAKELVNDGINGYLCNLDNDDFYTKILYLHHHKELRDLFSSRNIETASHYTIENNANAHLSNISNVIG